MSNYRRLEKNAQRLYEASGQLSVNVPKVIERRISMIAQQNPLNNSKELHEIERMVTEKPIAFFESWQNIMMQSWISQQHIGQMMMTNWIKLAFGQSISIENIFYQVNNETLKILEKGMQPISRRVSDNVSRLT